MFDVRRLFDGQIEDHASDEPQVVDVQPVDADLPNADLGTLARRSIQIDTIPEVSDLPTSERVMRLGRFIADRTSASEPETVRDSLRHFFMPPKR